MVNKEAHFVEFLEKQGILFERNVDLKRKTWIKRGGVSAFWIVPGSSAKMEELILYLHNEVMDFEIIGSSSNCYFFR